jgi:predicted AAA+ superfamily ATPase
MTQQMTLIPSVSLSGATELTLRRFNPWWSTEPGILLPNTRRHIVGQIHLRLKQRLAPIVVVRGARQIGKTTAQLQVLDDLLKSGMDPKRVLRIQFDDLEGIEKLEDPIIRLVDWYEHAILGMSLNEAARRGEPAFLFFDEVQNLDNWAPQLKTLVDGSTVQVVVTGSSALRIELGRDSLAGRITTIEAGVLSLTEVGLLRNVDLGTPFLPDNGLHPLTESDFWRNLTLHGRALLKEKEQVFAWFSERGGYPVAHIHEEAPWNAVADQLNENVIRRVIKHDLRMGERGRKRDAQLLEELFRAVCRYAGQAPPIHTLSEDVRVALQGNAGETRIRSYLKFLADSLLIRTIDPLEIRLKRKRSASKLCLADHALRASWLQEDVPLDPILLDRNPDLGTIAGHLAESVVGATLCTVNGLDINHKPEMKSEPEVDFIITVGTKRVPIEVKYQATIDPVRDTAGLRTFISKKVNHADFGVLVTRKDTALHFNDNIIALPLSSLMLMR